jgi:parvulin-like peptidyl-prolyl isomerase
LKRFIFIPLPLLLLVFACSKKDPVVAHIGKERITLEEYKTAYLEVIKQPNAFDSRALREQFLDELIDRRLLASEAERLGMAAEEHLQYRIHANRDKNLRDAHFRKLIKPRIRYEQNDLERTYAWMNEERHLRHLFSPTQAGADSLLRLLQQGVDWDDLARTTFDDIRLAGSGGDLGWVGWEQMELDLANTAFTLPLNTPSQPVASSYGWHILQVVDWRKTPLLSQAQYELQKNNARTVLEQKLGDKLALAYVGAMMKQKKIQLYPRSLRAVGQKLGVVLQRQPSTADQLRTEQLTDAEMGQIEASLWEMRHEPLASIDGEILTVGEFIAALTYVPYHAVHRSLKSALDFVLRDRALTREARTMGLERDPEVRIKTDLFTQNRLQMARRLTLLADIRVDDADLQRYYSAHYATSYPDLSFTEVKELLVRDALIEKRAQTMTAHLQELRSSVKITRNPAPIHAWYDGVLHKK